MPVPDSSALTPRQHRAAAALLRGPATAVASLARRFAAEGYELALVGGSVRGAFLGRRRGDLDLATDARPGEVQKIAAAWADTVWDTGIEFGTVGLRRGSLVCEITTYRSEQYRPESRKPAQVAYGRSLEADLARRADQAHLFARARRAGAGDLAAGRHRGGRADPAGGPPAAAGGG
jgi:poly(A) polymerase